MSVERVWRWACDGCGLKVERDDYGLPPGWIFVKAREITHRCPGCAESIPAGRRGIPKVTAEK